MKIEKINSITVLKTASAKLIKEAQQLKPGDHTWIDEKFKFKALGAKYETYATQPVKIMGGDKIDAQNNPNDATLVKQFPKSQYIYRARLLDQSGHETNQEIAFGNEYIRTQQQSQPGAQQQQQQRTAPNVGGAATPYPPSGAAGTSGGSSSATSQSGGMASSVGAAPTGSVGAPATASGKRLVIKMSKRQWQEL